MSNISNDEENINVNIEEDNENKTNEEATNKETAKEIKKEEIIEVENKGAEEVDNKKISFKDAFSSICVDALITGALSVVGIILLDVILRVTVGYYVKEKASMFLIIYIIMTILYTSIMESSKGNTVGRRLAKLKVTKME